jgi:selenocysteine lyase/cysteine desulfurase
LSLVIPIFNKFTKRLSFLDSAASTQKPAYVIKKLSDLIDKIEKKKSLLNIF